MKIASVVILYNPVDEVIKNILSYIDYVEKVYVIDNTEKTNIEIENSISSFPKAIFISDGENKGIANRLNQACKLAVKDGFDWLLTMDQDSSFSIKDISTYKNCVQQLANTDQIAVTGVEIVRNENEGINCGFTEVTSLITSGSMINLALLNAIGVFDEALFIDQVDFEYCYRALLKGYKVIQFNNVFLKHSLGVLSTHRSLKNFKNTYRTLHSPIRIYYMTRNYLYIKSKYKKYFTQQISATKKDLFIRIKNNLLYGKERLKVLKYLITGIIDFKRKKMGKFFLKK